MADTPTIDETPIASALPQRRDSLEKHLQTRPEIQDLQNRAILVDPGIAPSIQSARRELARQKVSESLKKNLEHRPGREELVEKNILPATLNTAPALQANARELEKHMIADNLDQKIASRPSPEQLIEKGILEERDL
ncbi:hypothetical protein VTN31DRAFT_366 [Thermomyces dupontii]|uniref:uncharacterized protein n=1 Tax=Talaromyces thermophilus TaxID=28565 RepID=UPI00374227ED